jgi:hypothetical protein
MGSIKNINIVGKEDSDLEIQALCRAYLGSDAWGKELILNTALTQVARWPSVPLARSAGIASPGPSLD